MGYAVIPTSQWTPFVTVWTGFTSDPTGLDCAYSYDPNKKICDMYIMPAGNGTGTGTTSTCTLPIAAATQQVFMVRVNNNGIFAAGMLITRVGSTIADIYATAQGGAFTTATARLMQGSFSYRTI